MNRVADFHCDLLWYLSNDLKRGVHDPESQCSAPLLKEGGVAVQTFPIYTVTRTHSVREGTKQFEIFDKLSHLDPDFFGPRMRYKLAIENASGFCSEEELLEEGLKRLESWLQKYPIVYISFTWNEENRFGGGAETNIGLKEDGKKLLEWMSGKKIAVDLSHASDVMAEAILKEIETLDVMPIASHSNFRAVCSQPRNLPDHLALAIAARGGLIGLNMVRHFLGKNGPHDIIAHIKYAQELGIENHLCLGTDFFPEQDVSEAKAHMRPYFFEGFSTPACYPELRKILLSAFTEEFVDSLMYYRLNHFLETQ
ncbi:MAG: membrane dipeptidase [Rhabdochlamydiaceae bacterium]|jgi:microsomal dipeptidase-like Zn-dependent dipeptidase